MHYFLAFFKDPFWYMSGMQVTNFFLLEKKDFSFPIIRRIQSAQKNEIAVQRAK